jgi:hypothetical protein
MNRILTSTFALALVALAGQPLYAEKKDDDKDKGRRDKSAAIAKKKNVPTSVARTTREIAPGRESAPGLTRRFATPSSRQVQAIERAPQTREGTRVLRSQPVASRAVLESRRIDNDRGDGDRRFDDRRDNDRRDNDRRDNDSRWANDRQRSWQRYSHYHAPSSAYRNWERHRTYSWNDHRYHWYGGSWIIIDPGYAYVESSPRLSAVGGNVVAEVQVELQRAGYHPGPADGVIGGRTRSAIAQYQSDRNLPVTGRIDRPLLSSLGI